MLIRLISHFKDNPNHIDKLINIEGLPQEWMFKEKDGKRFLKGPWEFDVTHNIPADIRARFQPEPMEVWTETPSEQRPGQFDPNLPKWVTDKHLAYGLRIDYQTGPGKDMWDQVEEILDRETPRHLKVPKPEKVGDRQQWTLTAEKVPTVKLKGEVEPVEAPAPKIEIVQKTEEVKIEPVEFPCADCKAIFGKSKALQMHRMKVHAARKAVAA